MKFQQKDLYYYFIEIIYIYEFFKLCRVCYRYCVLFEVYVSKILFMMLVMLDEQVGLNYVGRIRL